MLRVLVAWCACVICAQIAQPRAPQELPAASAVASPKIYVSIAPVPRGNMFEVAVVVGIIPGFHMNAHKVSEDYLIPTTLTEKLPAGLKEAWNQLSGRHREKAFVFGQTPAGVYRSFHGAREVFHSGECAAGQSEAAVHAAVSGVQ